MRVPGISFAVIRALTCLLVALCALLIPGCTKQRTIDYWFVDSLTKIFPDDPTNAGTIVQPYVYQTARNTHTSIQLALRSKVTLGDLYVDLPDLTGPGMPIDTISIRWVDNVVVTSNTGNTPKEELVRAAPGLFPDVLLSEFPITLKKDRTTLIWITVYVPAEQQPGTYRGPILLRQGNQILANIPFSMAVHGAVVPSPVPLNVSNHFNLNEQHLQQFYGCSQFSESWWQVIRNIAGFMGRYHQTSIGANPVRLANAQVLGGRLQYDFSNFERFVETFQIAGVPGPIEGGNLLSRQRRRDAPIMVSAWVVEDGKPALVDVEFKDPRAQQFLNTFLPALHQTLERRGWTKSYLQSILDEPNSSEVADFVRGAELVRKHLPGVRTMEPVGARQDLAFMEKNVDIWVPQLGTFDDKLPALNAHAKGGGEVWFYTCLGPTGRYPNRFIDYSLLKVRLLHWINFKHDFKGFLHWGGNYWGPEPLLDTQPVINEGRTYLPSGDAYITYPNRLHRSLYSSIRLEQMREGIEDFGFLSELAKHDEAKAQEIVGQAIQSFTDYVRDVNQFRAIHLKLLRTLSQAQTARISRDMK